MSRQQSVVLGVVLAVLFLVVMLWPKTVPSDAVDDIASPAPMPAEPVLSAAPDAQPEPAAAPDTPAPAAPLPSQVPLAKHIDPDTRQLYNRAVSNAIMDIREGCFDVLIAEGALQTRDEFVFDAVVVDGEVIDLKIRALVPASKDTMNCVHNAAWDAGWPKISVAGEMTFQRVFMAR